jgi:hypothetical protein
MDRPKNFNTLQKSTQRRSTKMVQCPALPLMDVENLIWENVKTQFEADFCATPTVSSVIQKLP